MDPMLFLTTEDDFQRLVMLATARATQKRMDELDRNRATGIANAVWKAVK